MCASVARPLVDADFVEPTVEPEPPSGGEGVEVRRPRRARRTFSQRRVDLGARERRRAAPSSVCPFWSSPNAISARSCMITSPKSGRCIGSGCQHDVTSSAKPCGQCGGTFGRSAWSPATAAAICSEDMYVRSYARLRVNISHATIPNEYTSTFWLYCSPRCTSGAMYRALPV